MVDIKVFGVKYALEAESRRYALVQNQVPENIHHRKVLFSAEISNF
jgi:nucleoporin GLE1